MKACRQCLRTFLTIVNVESFTGDLSSFEAIFDDS